MKNSSVQELMKQLKQLCDSSRSSEAEFDWWSVGAWLEHRKFLYELEDGLGFGTYQDYLQKKIRVSRTEQERTLWRDMLGDARQYVLGKALKEN